VSSQGINEASVKKLLVKLDKAIASQNVSEMGQTLSEDAQLLMTTRVSGRSLTVEYTKREYLADVRDTLHLISNHTHRRSNEKITISAGIATVSTDVVETGIIGGKFQTIRSKEVYTIELINNVPLVTKVVVNSSM
jgi:hypothetical protein